MLNFPFQTCNYFLVSFSTAQVDIREGSIADQAQVQQGAKEIGGMVQAKKMGIHGRVAGHIILGGEKRSKKHLEEKG